MITPLSPKWIVFAVVAMTAVATSAQDKSAPAMTLVVDETQVATITYKYRPLAYRTRGLAWSPNEAPCRISA